MAGDRKTRPAEDLLSRRETVMGDQLKTTAEDSLLVALRAATPPLDD